MAEQSTVELRERVRARYAAAAPQVTSGGHGSCCGDGCGCGRADSTQAGLRGTLHRVAERDGRPPEAREASLGCGNPHAVADLREGETVLDLGSGGGIDVLLSARRGGPTRQADGLDMTDA